MECESYDLWFSHATAVSIDFLFLFVRFSLFPTLLVDFVLRISPFFLTEGVVQYSPSRTVDPLDGAVPLSDLPKSYSDHEPGLVSYVLL